MDTLIRCPWPGSDELMIKYHDTEWGTPNHDDAKLFEFMILDMFQAGLSWRIVLHKREGFRSAFHGFDVHQVAIMTPEDVERLVLDAGIIRNRAKIIAAIHNASLYIELQQEFGSFANYFWSFVDGTPVQNHFTSDDHIPATDSHGDAASADLRRRGFKFLGPTVVYAYMQGAGLINDHITSCFRHRELTT